ncbi:GTP-binding protein REM 1 isoform X2 [Orcinus orca]|uniref:GTP-binding protein REM 1 isoform X2 n=1 Tax=Sagmatias obliquidens TaxID=3371155 RepID=UPI000F444909|nr:GTP-binding protein REM 1 isoform X2 [Lagenorhynchus obliquidens]XP_033289328.1 GTP-binding protein REM 1 isoform X2 [Orcinus orca]
MTLNTQQEAKTPLRRRASTPLPLSTRGHQPGLLGTAPSTQSQHPRLGQSASLNTPTRQPSSAPSGWSSESSDSEGSWEALYRVVLLGDPGVGKTSLANLFAGKQERDLHEQLGVAEDVYERTLTVDGEDTTLLVVDTWEAEKLDESWSQESCLQVGSAYVIVYSIADRGSFESASELRIQLRRTYQADHVPIILVGNKADLARCREVSVEARFISESPGTQHEVWGKEKSCFRLRLNTPPATFISFFRLWLRPGSLTPPPQRAAPALWCSTANSSRRQPRCSTTWRSSSKA